MAPKAKKTTTKKETTKKTRAGPYEAPPPAPDQAPPQPDAEEKKKFRVACKAGLLTYIHGDTDIGNLEDLSEMFFDLKAKFKNDLNLSLCLEICPKTNVYHLHLFFQCDEVIDCDLQYFKTSKSGTVSDCKPNNGGNILRGHFYVQCEWKSSQVCCKFDVYVKPLEKWVMDLWKDDKIEKIKDALAAYKLLKPQLVQQIDCQQNYYDKLKCEKMIAERQDRMEAKKRKFAPVPVVVQWLLQYLEELFRYNFLVLHGPSKKNKTMFAKSLFKNPHVHEDKIDWDGYSWVKNDGIIFDDCNLPDHIWKFVRQNKVLFQASGTVAVNTSATNCYKKDICVVQKPIIICTNDALLEPFVSAPYREWISSNCVWVDVPEVLPFEENVAAVQ